MPPLFSLFSLIPIVGTIIEPSNGFTVHNSLLTGHAFKTFVSSDWLLCVSECHKHDMCLSYNYFPPEQICELNDFGSDLCMADDHLIRVTGWVHHTLHTSQVIMQGYIRYYTLN